MLAAGALLLVLARDVPAGVVFVATGLVGVGYAGAQVFPLAMLPDVAAVDAARTGRTAPASSPACGPRARRSGSRSGPASSALVLALGGYVARPAAASRSRRPRVTAIVLGFSLLPALLTARQPGWLRRYR